MSNSFTHNCAAANTPTCFHVATLLLLILLTNLTSDWCVVHSKAKTTCTTGRPGQWGKTETICQTIPFYFTYIPMRERERERGGEREREREREGGRERERERDQTIGMENKKRE